MSPWLPRRFVITWGTAKALALAVPGAEERDHFGSPSFRVKGKIFAQLSAAHASEARALLKLAAADQSALTMLDPATFIPAPHWGRHGWTYIRLAAIDEATFCDLLEKSRRLIAVKQQVGSPDDAAQGVLDP